MHTGRRFKIGFNSPAVLLFVLLCVVVRIFDMLTRGGSNELLFSVYRSSLLNPLTYVRCVCHVLGHADWGHLMNNMLYILLLGPMLEEKYGSARLALVMLAAAVATGIVHMIFFPNVTLLGASGIVFAFILLSSVTSTEAGTIPVTFILVAVLYIGQQIYQGIFERDNISQLSHIIGGAVGSAAGFAAVRLKRGR